MSKRDRRVAARTKAASPAGDQDQPEPPARQGRRRSPRTRTRRWRRSSR